MVLGDNIFHGNGLEKLLISAFSDTQINQRANIFGYYVNDPKRYGVLNFDSENNVLSIEEKPDNPKSNYAVLGLYFYPNSVIEMAKNIKPSKRGELEITEINNTYLNNNNLKVEILETGNTWLDTGSPDSLLEASNFIQAIEKRQGLKVACIEEIVFNKGYINKKQLATLANEMYVNEYSGYLKKILSS